MFICLLKWLSIVLIHSGYNNKILIPQTGWPVNSKHFFLTFLEAWSLQSGASTVSKGSFPGQRIRVIASRGRWGWAVLFSLFYKNANHIHEHSTPMACCSSVSRSCPTLCDPIDHSPSGFLSFTISQSLLKLLSIESMMPSNHLVFFNPCLSVSYIPQPIISHWALEFQCRNVWIWGETHTFRP